MFSTQSKSRLRGLAAGWLPKDVVWELSGCTNRAEMREHFGPVLGNVNGAPTSHTCIVSAGPSAPTRRLCQFLIAMETIDISD